MIAEAVILEEAGASLLLLECVPVDLGKSITERLEIPVIGIGAGPHVDGQIMVMHDVLGLTLANLNTPRFVKNFLAESKHGIPGAFAEFAEAVRTGTFPSKEHCFF